MLKFPGYLKPEVRNITNTKKIRRILYQWYSPIFVKVLCDFWTNRNQVLQKSDL